jgi:hypothetical protein
VTIEDPNALLGFWKGTLGHVRIPLAYLPLEATHMSKDIWTNLCTTELVNTNNCPIVYSKSSFKFIVTFAIESLLQSRICGENDM